MPLVLQPHRRTADANGEINVQKAGEQQERQENGQFAPGQSGNPEGRKHGSKNKLSKLREKLLIPILPEAIDKLKTAVGEGQRWAIELVVSYSISKPKPVDPEELDEFERRLDELEQMARGH